MRRSFGPAIVHIRCNHVFHELCIQEWFKNAPKGSSCPLCRENITQLKIADDDKLKDDCPICYDSMTKTAQRLKQLIIQTQDGKYMHEECHLQNLPIMQQFAAKNGLATPTFNFWQPWETMWEWEVILNEVLRVILMLSNAACIVNANIQFSNPILHLLSIPFYVIIVAMLVESIYLSCEEWLSP